MHDTDRPQALDASVATLDADDLDCLEDLLSFYVRSANYALSADLDARLGNLEVARGTGKITTLLLIDSHPGIRASAIAEATRALGAPPSRASMGEWNMTFLPSNQTSPASGTTAPETALIRVDLPAPLSPITARISPG